MTRNEFWIIFANTMSLTIQVLVLLFSIAAGTLTPFWVVWYVGFGALALYFLITFFPKD